MNSRHACWSWLALLVLGGCDNSKNNAVAQPQGRSIAVQAEPETSQETPKTSASAAPSAETAAKPPRALCEGQLDKPGKKLPNKKIGRAAGEGAREPSEELATDHGGWTWLNLWAAWCVPCKEEIPRLQSWRQKLRDAGSKFDLQFVSLDDDQRQLQGFLDAQSATGLKSTYWLREGKERSEWLEEVGVEPDPELPGHILVDPSGMVRCYIQGAVEDGDYPQVAKLVGQ